MADIKNGNGWKLYLINILMLISGYLLAGWINHSEASQTLARSNEIRLTRLETNFDNIYDILKEVRNDVKDLKNK